MLQPFFAVYHTDAGAAVGSIQVGREDPDLLTNDFDISVYAVVESADPLTGNWTTQSLLAADETFVSDSETPIIQFDQICGSMCGAAVVNLDPFSTANLIVEILDNTGTQIEYATLTIVPLGHVQFVPTEHFPLSIGITGSMRFVNAKASTVPEIGMIGIKAGPYKSGWTQTSLPVVTLLN